MEKTCAGIPDSYALFILKEGFMKKTYCKWEIKILTVGYDIILASGDPANDFVDDIYPMLQG